MTFQDLLDKLHLSRTSDANRDTVLALARILPSDYAEARKAWKRYAPSKYAGMLDGRGFKWDASRQIYVTTDGRDVTPEQLKAIAIAVVKAAQDDIAEMATGLALAGLMQWSERTAAAIKAEYLAMAALGAGGFDQMTPAMEQFITGDPRVPGPTIAYTAGRVAETVQAIHEEDEPEIPESLDSRTLPWSASGHSLMESVRRESHRRTFDEDPTPGVWVERNLLDPMEKNHCHRTQFRPGCPELTNLGWQPFGTLALPGQRSCHHNCRCVLVYRKIPASALATTRN